MLRTLLENGLVPLVQGDVALDTVRGATIVSTEDVFIYLAREFQPTHILLAGEVAGVFENADMTGAIIPVITPGNVAQYVAALGGSHGTDVTGGMIGKVQQMLGVVQQHPDHRGADFLRRAARECAAVVDRSRDADRNGDQK